MEFNGFPPDASAFLEELAANNNRDWFIARKPRYQQSVELPAKAFLDALIPALAAIAGAPMGGKIFRINRDVRFSKDKTPYNAHVRILVHSLEEKGDGCGAKPSFYFSLEPDKVIVGAGSMEFPKATLENYRAAVDGEKTGVALLKLLARFKPSEGYRVDEPELKRIPTGFPPDHPRESLLRRKGLAVWHEHAPDARLHNAGALKHLMAHYKKLIPLYDWLNAC